MNYYFAPLEGITYYNFRQAHHQFFPGIDAYYTPFVVATYTHKMKSREKRDILPENNIGVPVVPQILTNRPEEFLFCAKYMADFGYTEVNLNAGCPVGTVTSKGKGAGLLKDPDELDRFLDGVFNGIEREKVTVSPVNEVHEGIHKNGGDDKNEGSGSGRVIPLSISVKTRLGWEDPDEFERILEVYMKYPISKLIIHARTRKELYGGEPEMEAFARAYETVYGSDGENDRTASLEKMRRISNLKENAGPDLKETKISEDSGGSEKAGMAAKTAEKGKKGKQTSKMQLCYNGNVFTPEDAERIEKRFPKLDAIMIGRGLLRDPALVMKIHGREIRRSKIGESGPTSEKQTENIIKKWNLSDSENKEGSQSRMGEMINYSAGEEGSGYYKRIREFHDSLYERYQEQFRDDRILVDHMKELWTYLRSSFPGSERCIKAIHKARNRLEYEAAVRVLFGTFL